MKNFEIVDKFEEIKRVGIIKDFKVVNKPNGKIGFDIDFFDDLPPKQALNKLDYYLAEKKRNDTINLQIIR